MNKISIRAVLIVCATLTAGCTYSGDTSGFKSEKKPSREEITRQIAQVKANATMPSGVKEMALKKLEKQLADAR